jgi:hypothetical protein
MSRDDERTSSDKSKKIQVLREQGQTEGEPNTRRGVGCH